MKDFFFSYVFVFKSLQNLNSMMADLGSDMNHIFEVIVDLVQKSSETHDKTSIGHLHRLMYVSFFF